MNQYTLIAGVNGTGKSSSFRGVLEGQGYAVVLYYIGLSSAQESIARIENRVRKGGHGIPCRVCDPLLFPPLGRPEPRPPLLRRGDFL